MPKHTPNAPLTSHTVQILTTMHKCLPRRKPRKSRAEDNLPHLKMKKLRSREWRRPAKVPKLKLGTRPGSTSLAAQHLPWARPPSLFPAPAEPDQLTPEPSASRASICTGITWKLHLNSKSETVISEWGLRFCISNKLPSDAAAAGPQSTDGREGLAACDSIFANSDFYFLYNLWLLSLQEISLALSLP